MNNLRTTTITAKATVWEAGPRSAAEFIEAAAHYERAAALCTAPALQAEIAECARQCRSLAS